jgi:transposase InsO family protein
MPRPNYTNYSSGSNYRRDRVNFVVNSTAAIDLTADDDAQRWTWDTATRFSITPYLSDLEDVVSCDLTLNGAFDGRMDDAVKITKMGRIIGITNQNREVTFVAYYCPSVNARLISPNSLYDSGIVFRDALPGDSPWLELDYPGMRSRQEPVAYLIHDPVNGYPVLDLYTAIRPGEDFEHGMEIAVTPARYGLEQAPYNYTNYVLATLPVSYHGEEPNQQTTSRAATSLSTMEVRTIAARRDLLSLHIRLGHPSNTKLQHILTTPALYGLPSMNPQLIRLMPPCPACSKGKTVHRRAMVDVSRPKLQNLERLHIDTAFGPRSAPYKGCTAASIIIDAASCYVWGTLVRGKDAVKSTLFSLVDQLRLTFNHSPPHRNVVTEIRTDQGELLSRAVRTWASDNNIKHTTTTGYASWQNGPVERVIRTVFTMANVMLLPTRLPLWCWGYALKHAVHVYNIMPHRYLNNISPTMQLYGTQPRLDYLHPFGCKAIVYEPSARRPTRFHPRGRDCVYVGHTSPHSVTLIDLATGVEETAHHVNIRFFDESFPSLRDHERTAPIAFEHYERRREADILLAGESEVFGGMGTNSASDDTDRDLPLASQPPSDLRSKVPTHGRESGEAGVTDHPSVPHMMPPPNHGNAAPLSLVC